MQLTTLQQRRDKWVARNFPGDEMVNSILGAVEELGELAHHFLKKKQGVRIADHDKDIADAVADTVIFLAGVCSHLGIDYGQLVHDTWEEVEKRDWVDFPKNGLTE